MAHLASWRGHKKKGTNPFRWKYVPRCCKRDIFEKVFNGALADDKPLALEVGTIYNNGILPECFTTLDLLVGLNSPSWNHKFLKNNGLFPDNAPQCPIHKKEMFLKPF